MIIRIRLEVADKNGNEGKIGFRLKTTEKYGKRIMSLVKIDIMKDGWKKLTPEDIRFIDELCTMISTMCKVREMRPITAIWEMEFEEVTA